MGKKTAARVNLERSFLGGGRLARLIRELGRPRCMIVGLLSDLWAESQTEERIEATAEEICEWSRLWEIEDWLRDTDFDHIHEDEWIRALLKTKFLVDLGTGYYRICGNAEQLDGLREHREVRAEGARVGGERRAAEAERDENGRFKPKPPAETQPAGPADPAPSSPPAEPASIQFNSSHGNTLQIIPEEEGEPPAAADPLAEFLKDIPEAARRSWDGAYGANLVAEQLPLARAGWESNPERQSDYQRATKGGKAGYLRRWLQNVHDDRARQAEKTPPPEESPPIDTDAERLARARKRDEVAEAARREAEKPDVRERVRSFVKQIAGSDP